MSQETSGAHSVETPKKFAAMVGHAERRLSPLLEFKILPTDPAAIPEYIKATQAVQQLSRMIRDTSGVPVSHPSMLIVSDGRRESSHRSINGVLNKAAKASEGAIKTATPFRLMHSNAEFTNNRNLRGGATKTVPEPLETLSICTTTDFKVRPVGRKYLDLPGTNRTRGLNNVPLKTRTAEITWNIRCEILSGSCNTAPADEEAFDLVDADDEEDQAEAENGTNRFAES